MLFCLYIYICMYVCRVGVSALNRAWGLGGQGFLGFQGLGAIRFKGFRV